MNKLRLTLDDLRIESFDTTAAAGEKGTVAAQEDCTCMSACPTFCPVSCPGLPTCADTCPETCSETCDDFTCWETCGLSCGGTCRDFSCRCPLEPEY
jgi:hypothetical protein